ncbi:hypothetical protein F5Y17DRAFT_469518 [Xylariaceae sp. FL0594]|nr:hypothetical protein F5Y17DRAFT_469518 [Xylariaceae sp. FL0594]
MSTAPLSPVSTEMNVSCVDSTAMSPRVAPVHLPASTWDASYPDDDSGEDVDRDVSWDDDSGDGGAVPKIEPMEEESFRMEDVQQAPYAPEHGPHAGGPPSSQAKAKRPRGRPRKHPVALQDLNSKVAKGRSKTGCITCRKRKKKCDEAKPRCLNCEKNAVVCEGYHEKTIWKSGRERAEEERQRRQSLPQITLQPIFQGVETAEDRIFLNHYINNLSSVLTVEGQHKNAFKDMLLQMALGHRGLMHAILSLAGKHIDFDTPYGSKLLSSNPGLDREGLIARSDYHHEKSMPYLLVWGLQEGHGQEDRVDLACRYGQMLCLLLKTAAEGAHAAEHRVHLHAYKNLIFANPPPDKAFTTFISEFFQYRVFTDELIRYPGTDEKRLATEDWVPWHAIEPARLIGVGDGLFHYLSMITTIKNEIRDNIAANVRPVVNSKSVQRANEIETAIREWAPVWPAGDNRDRVSLLYKQMMWVYLFRTVWPPVGSSLSSRARKPPTAAEPTSSRTVDGGSGASKVSTVTTGDGNNALPLSPASSNPSSSTRSPPALDRRMSSASGTLHAKPPNAIADTGSPPPTVRLPPHHDAGFSNTVDESLAILDSFKPSDPVQTLLFVPCLVIGCASFAPAQQERIRAAIRTVRGYTGLRNCDCLLRLLEEIWRLMAEEDWMSVWDWQKVASGMGLDFSCA